MKQQAMQLGDIKTAKLASAEALASMLTGVFADPVIVYPGHGWERDIPDWVKEQVALDRLAAEKRKLDGESELASDTEAMAYMMPASLSFPLNHTWTTIYQYLATRTIEKFGHGKAPDDMRVDSLGKYEEEQLRHLKRWLYEQRLKVRSERARAERKQRAEEKVEIQYGQPSLFGEGGDK